MIRCGGVYGESFSVSNQPGARYGSIIWNVASNSFLFGGYGCTSLESSGYLSDLWVIEKNDENEKLSWKFVSKIPGGDDDADNSKINPIGVYNEGGGGCKYTKEYFISYSFPGGRYGAGKAFLEDGEVLVIFGGFGVSDSISKKGYLRDLWFIRSSDAYSAIIFKFTDVGKSGSMDDYREFSSDNEISSRKYPALWVSVNGGYIFLFGGYGCHPENDNVYGYLNDLMIIRRSDKNVNWYNGANNLNSEGTIDSPGFFSLDNIPGARFGSIIWTSEDRIYGYMFGGFGFEEGSSKSSNLNDLWILKLSDSQDWEMKRISSEDADILFTDNYGNEKLFLKASNSTKDIFPPTVFLPTYFPIDNELFFYGGSNHDETKFYSSLWSIRVDPSLNTISFKYHRFASALCNSYVCSNPSNSLMTNTIPYYNSMNKFLNQSNNPGGSSQGYSIYLMNSANIWEYFVVSGKTWNGNNVSLSLDVWKHSEYSWKCGDISNKNISYMCSEVDGAICRLNWTCDCGNTPYSGNLCEIFDCYNISMLNSSVCFGHGKCESIDSCKCYKNYYSSMCDHFYCYNISHLDSNVCFGHGKCNSPDNCSCDEEYYSLNCDNYDCYNISHCDSNVCFGHGKCNSPNNCSCDIYYYSSNCDNYDCFGVSVKSEDVCSNRNGSCVSPNNCSCNLGYYGDSCEFYYGDSLMYDDPSVCNSHGKCDNFNYCSCEKHYYGSFCEINECFGVSSSNKEEDVCSGHGICVEYNNCSCMKNYFAFDCHYFECFSKNNSQPDICSGKGQCISPNNCRCLKNFNGSSCNEFECFQQSRNDPKVCHSGGKCVENDTCECYNSSSKTSKKDIWGVFGERCECNVSTSGGYFKVLNKDRYYYFVPFRVHKSFLDKEGHIYLNAFDCFGSDRYEAIIKNCSENIELLGSYSMDSSCKFIYEKENNFTKYLRIKIDDTNGFSNGSKLILRPMTSDDNITVLFFGSIPSIPKDENPSYNPNGTVTEEKTHLFSLVFSVVTFSCVLLCFLPICVCCFCFIFIFGVLCVGYVCLSLLSLLGCVIIFFGVCLIKKAKQLERREENIQKIVFGDLDPDDLDSMFEELVKPEKRGLKQLIKHKKRAGHFLKNSARFNFNLELFRIDAKELKLLKILGNGGSTSIIYLAMWKSQEVAVKVFHTNRIYSSYALKNSIGISKDDVDFDFEEFERELNILGSISHPHIIPIYGCSCIPPKVCLVLEYMPNKDLRSYFFKCKQRKNPFFDFPYKLLFFAQVCSAVEYLHFRNIIHRDIKSDNILLTKNLVPKIIDFGVSKIFEKAVGENNFVGMQTKKVGTAQYMAPEIMSGKYNESCDIFSLSIIVYEVMTGEFNPYKSRIEQEMFSSQNSSIMYTSPIEYLVQKNPNFRPIIPKDFQKRHKSITALMCKMWEHDSSRRPKISEVKEFFETLLEKKDFHDDDDSNLIEKKKSSDSYKSSESNEYNHHSFEIGFANSGNEESFVEGIKEESRKENETSSEEEELSCTENIVNTTGIVFHEDEEEDEEIEIEIKGILDDSHNIN